MILRVRVRRRVAEAEIHKRRDRTADTVTQCRDLDREQICRVRARIRLQYRLGAHNRHDPQMRLRDLRQIEHFAPNSDVSVRLPIIVPMAAQLARREHVLRRTDE